MYIVSMSIFIYIYNNTHMLAFAFLVFHMGVHDFSLFLRVLRVIIQGHGGMRPWKGAENSTCRQPVQCFQVVVLDYILLGVDGFAPVEMLPESTQVLQVIRMISILD